MQQLIAISAAILLLLAMLAVIELLARKKVYPLSVARKLTHTSVSLLICLVAGLFLDYQLFVPLGLIFAGLLYTVRYVLPLKSLADRASKSYGEVFFGLGVASAAYISNDTSQFVAVVAILGLADTAAYFIGRWIKSPKLLFGKSLAGSLAFMLVSLAICLFITTPVLAVTVAVILAICEQVSPYGSDNLTVPAIAAGLIHIM